MMEIVQSGVTAGSPFLPLVFEARLYAAFIDRLAHLGLTWLVPAACASLAVMALAVVRGARPNGGPDEAAPREPRSLAGRTRRGDTVDERLSLERSVTDLGGSVGAHVRAVVRAYGIEGVIRRLAASAGLLAVDYAVLSCVLFTLAFHGALVRGAVEAAPTIDAAFLAVVVGPAFVLLVAWRAAHQRLPRPLRELVEPAGNGSLGGLERAGRSGGSNATS